MRRIWRVVVPSLVVVFLAAGGCKKKEESGDAPADGAAAAPADAGGGAAAPAAAAADASAAASADGGAVAAAGEGTQGAAAEPQAAAGEGDPSAPDPEPKPEEVAALNDQQKQQGEGVTLPEPQPVEDKPEAIDPQTGEAKEASGQSPVELDPAKDPKAAAEMGQTGVKDVGVFTAALRPYGTWMNDPEYGPVWYPNPAQVGTNFHPYTRGTWVVTRAGYYFRSEFPEWGWATDHFGRWYKTDKSPVAWAWVPGTEFAPAHVMWRRGDAVIGWAPLPPKYNYMQPVAVPADWFTFVRVRHFLNPYVYRYWYPPTYRWYWYNRLPLVVSVRYYNGLPYYYGPRWAWVRGWWPRYRLVSFRTVWGYYPFYRRYLVPRVYVAPRVVIRPRAFVRVYGPRLTVARVVRPSVRIGVGVGVGARVGVGVRVGAPRVGVGVGVRAGVGAPRVGVGVSVGARAPAVRAGVGVRTNVGARASVGVRAGGSVRAGAAVRAGGGVRAGANVRAGARATVRGGAAGGAHGGAHPAAHRAAPRAAAPRATPRPAAKAAPRSAPKPAPRPAGKRH